MTGQLIPLGAPLSAGDAARLTHERFYQGWPPHEVRVFLGDRDWLLEPLEREGPPFGWGGYGPDAGALAGALLADALDGRCNDCAVALCVDCATCGGFGASRTVRQLVGPFKYAHVARWPADLPWLLTRGDVLAWAAQRRPL